MVAPKYSFLIATVCLIAPLIPAQAGPIFLTSQGTTLIRVHNGLVESFEMGGPIYAMAFDPETRTVYGTTSGNHGAVILSLIENATSGRPQILLVAQMEHFYGGMAKAGEYFYGFEGGSTGRVYQIDASSPLHPIETLIGTTGVTGPGGAAYDPESNLLYMASLDTASLYAVNIETAETTLLGSTGIDPLGFGLEWWRDRLLVAVQNGDTDRFEVGELNPHNGEYIFRFDIGIPAQFQGTSMAIIPDVDPDSQALDEGALYETEAEIASDNVEE